jgi:cytochrome b
LKVTGVVGQKQAVAVRKSIETRHKQLAALKIRADALQLKYTSLTGLLNEDSSTVSVQFDVG